MDSRPTSDREAERGAAVFTFIAESGEQLPAGPEEWQSALVVLPLDPERWINSDFRRNGSPIAIELRRLGDHASAVAVWPRSNCGRYRLELYNGEVRQSALVTVFPKKFGQAALDAMVADLEERLPMSLAVALTRDEALAGAYMRRDQDSTIAQELGLLRRICLGEPGQPGLFDSLRRIAQDPLKTLTVERKWSNVDRARRPVPDRLFLALSKPGNLTATKFPVSVVDGVVQASFDLYENRLVRSVIERVSQRLSRVVTALADSQPARTEAQLLRRRLHAGMRESSFLKEVGELQEPPRTVTMALQRRPAYRVLLEASIELNRKLGVRFEGALTEGPLESTPKLYEAWATLSAVEVLIRACLDAGFESIRQRLIARDSHGWFVRLAQGVTPIIEFRHANGATVRAWYQRPVSRTSQPRTLTYLQVPDITIEFASLGMRELIVLDPKYKLAGDGAGDEETGELPRGTPQKTDLDKMHAYRDAIRDVDQPVVRTAAILYPGRSMLYPDGSTVAEAPLAAFQAIPGYEASQFRPLQRLLDSRLAALKFVTPVVARHA